MQTHRAFCLAAMLFVNAVLAAGPQVSIESPAAVAETYVGKPVRQTLTLKNGSDEGVKLLDVQVANKLVDLVSFNPSNASIPAHSSKEISIEFVSRLMLGAHRVPFDFYLLTNSGSQLKVRGDATTFVQSAFDLERLEVDLGVLDSKQRGAKSLTLTSREIPGIALKRVMEAPKFLSITLADGGKSLSIAPGDNIPWGLSQGYIKLQTNSDVQPEVWIHYQLDMHGVVVPSQNPVEFSSDSVGGEQEETVRLMRNDGKPVKVESVTASGVSFKTRIDECAPVAADCKLLRIALPADAPSGLIAGMVALKFEGLGNELPIVVGGFRLAKGQKLKSLSDDASTQTSKSIKTQPPLDINQAIERAKRRAEQPAAPPGKGPLLKWSVAHEGAIYGYLIYRGDTETGEFLRINKEIIRVQNDEDEGSSYQWRDNSAVPGKTYWYYIGIVNNNGSKKNLSSPQKVVAK